MTSRRDGALEAAIGLSLIGALIAINVDLPWPRDLDVTTGEGFINLKRHCLDRFWREVKRD